MAKVLKTFDFGWQRRTASVLPTEKWFDGRIHQLTKGEDFDLALSSLQSRLRKEAAEAGIEIRTKVVDAESGVIVVQAIL